ncbi:hypothetical protein [uncultured Celeribacter sp.]|uniref:hypothetical protein n=1 Tax=uncultured Celeribacter sp. TaxID=1303376 RepID=UPI002AA5EE6C|nr:hypothetical protein [uncultured Celeribacter sp.]
MDQRQDFLRRLQRVPQRSSYGCQEIGPAKTRTHGRNERLTEMLERHQAEGVHSRSYGEPRLKITQILSYVLAFAMGGLATVIARVVHYQISGAQPQEMTDFNLALDVILAIAIAFLLREAVSMSAVKRMGTQFAGILLAIMTMHNVVHEMPDLFSRLFSAQWVDYVTHTTEPGTLYFRGQSYRI